MNHLPAAALLFIRQNRGQKAHQLISQFHQWILSANHMLQALQPGTVDNFISLHSFTAQDSILLQRYLTMLFLDGKIPYNPQEQIKKLTTPSYISEYLEAHPKRLSRKIVEAFHRWLKEQHITLDSFDLNHFDQFLLHLRKRNKNKLYCRGYYTVRARESFKYITFLCDKKIIPIDSSILGAHQKNELPSIAQRFIQELSVARKRGTISAYRVSLQSFHTFLLTNDIVFGSIGRAEVLRWLLWLKEKNLHPATRRTQVIHLRLYFEWLFENKIIRAAPSTLVFRSDLPKLPDYLPRPLAPDIDEALLKFLHRKRHIGAKALIIMRKAGLRIGELQNLAFDCVHSDLHGNYLLKVPLGKLNNERLVPIHPDTFTIIEDIKKRGPIPRRYLISQQITRPLPIMHIVRHLDKFSSKQKLQKKIVSHQLRHTCATELINAGMSLASIMRFLGHHDIRMTLRYARITQETVLREFHAALPRVEAQYQIKSSVDTSSQQCSPVQLLSDVIKWMQKFTPSTSTKSARIIKRLYKLRSIIEKIKPIRGQ